jgi:hypothetical protein
MNGHGANTVLFAISRRLSPDFLDRFCVLAGSRDSAANGDMLASLINASWNPLVEWLKRLETLRECVQRRPEYRLKP